MCYTQLLAFELELDGVSFTHIGVEEYSGILLRISGAQGKDVFIVEDIDVLSDFGLLLKKVLNEISGGDVNETEDVFVAVF